MPRNPGRTGSWETPAAFYEAFRILRVELAGQLASLPRPVIAVTSSRHGEGRTLACASLASAFAAGGRRVVAVDLDRRDPRLHLALGGHNTFGLTDHLHGRRRLRDSIQYVEGCTGRGAEHGLFLLAAGPPDADADEALDGDRLARLMDRMASQAEVIVVDTPPVLGVADTLTIGATAGGVLVVVDTRRTSSAAVQRARDLLERSGAHPLGIVLNQVRSGDAAAWLSDDTSPAGPTPARAAP